MPEPDPPPELPAGATDMQALARDWITLWQSELAAMAADREAQEAWQRLLAFWAQTASAWAGTMPARRPDDVAPRSPAAPRPAPAAPAPHPRDAEIDGLAGRIGELERRLAGLARDP